MVSRSKYKKKLLQLYKKLEVYPELKNVLEYLKEKKIKCCILSNGTPKLLKQLTKQAKIDHFFDSLISIEKVKIFKPRSKSLSASYKKIFLQASTSLFFKL